jgi:hypothetical protein
MAEATPGRKFKINDRVKRAKGTGCLGTVKDIRAETSASQKEEKVANLLVNVLWDNGTLSYFTPSALESVKE